MLALDTNVLVRYLAQDDPKQSAAATRFIEQRVGSTERGFVSLVALLETVWVMESRYGADAELVADILADLLDTASLEMQDAVVQDPIRAPGSAPARPPASPAGVAGRVGRSPPRRYR